MAPCLRYLKWTRPLRPQFEAHTAQGDVQPLSAFTQAGICGVKTSRVEKGPPIMDQSPLSNCQPAVL